MVDANGQNGGAQNAFWLRYSNRVRISDIKFGAGTQHTIIEGDTNAPGNSAGNVWTSCDNTGSYVGPGYAFHWKQNVTDSQHRGGWGGNQECGYWSNAGDHKFFNTHPNLGAKGCVGFAFGPKPGNTAGGSGNELHGCIPDNPNNTQHTVAGGVTLQLRHPHHH